MTSCYFRSFHRCNQLISIPRLLHCLLTCIPFPGLVPFHRLAAATLPDCLACWPAVTFGNDPPAYLDPGQICFKAASWFNLNVKLKIKLEFCHETFLRLLFLFEVQRSFNELDAWRRFPQSSGSSLKWTDLHFYSEYLQRLMDFHQSPFLISFPNFHKVIVKSSLYCCKGHTNMSGKKKETSSLCFHARELFFPMYS